MGSPSVVLAQTLTPDAGDTIPAPSVTISSSSASFSFTATEAGSSFECQLDGGSFAACGSPRTYSGMIEGVHTFQVRARDVAGNVDATPANFTWTVDITPADTTLTATPPSLSASSSASFSFTAIEAGSSFECQLDGGGFVACTGPKTYSGLSDGAHTFQVRAKDAAGNVDASPASFTWTVDTTAPAVTITTPTTNPTYTTTTSLLTLGGTAADTVGVTQVTWTNDRGGSGTATGTTSWTVSGIVLQRGVNILTVTARDAAGNTGSDTLTVTYGGLQGEYFDNADLTNLMLTRIDPAINFDYGLGAPPDTPLGADTFSIRWTGKLQTDVTETYTFELETDDGVRLWIDGHLVVDYWRTGRASNVGMMDLTAGLHDIKIEFFEETDEALARLYWSSPSMPHPVIVPQDHLSPPDAVGTAPQLSWTEEAGYCANGLDPEIGNTHTSFTYRVTYTDADGNAPMAGYPRVHILQGGEEITGSPFSMVFERGTPTAGAIYTYTATTLPVGKDYTYYFDAKDATGLQAVATPTIPTPVVSLHSPLVIAAPTLALRLNRCAFRSGETLTLTAAVTPGDTPQVVDVYVAVRLPDGSLLFLQGDGSVTTSVRPIVTGWTIAPFTGAVFHYTFGGGEPRGSYTWLGAFTVPGTLNFIGEIAQAPFTFRP